MEIWDPKEYEETFFSIAEEQGLKLNDENKAELKPLIAQACEKSIPTLRLVEIVKSGMKAE